MDDFDFDVSEVLDSVYEQDDHGEDGLLSREERERERLVRNRYRDGEPKKRRNRKKRLAA